MNFNVGGLNIGIEIYHQYTKRGKKMPVAQTKFITAYGPKTKVRQTNEGKTRTHQSGKDECDINLIMAKYVKTGVMDHQKEYGENYGFATSVDLHEALTTVRTATEMFDALPAEIRTRMDNNAEKFLEFVQNPENEKEMLELGLATSEPEVKPIPVVVQPVETPAEPTQPE